jgi:hypothetical protein
MDKLVRTQRPRRRELSRYLVKFSAFVVNGRSNGIGVSLGTNCYHGSQLSLAKCPAINPNGGFIASRQLSKTVDLV